MCLISLTLGIRSENGSVITDFNSDYYTRNMQSRKTAIWLKPMKQLRPNFTCANPRKNNCSGVKSKPGSFNSLLFFAIQVWCACWVKTRLKPIDIGKNQYQSNLIYPIKKRKYCNETVIIFSRISWLLAKKCWLILASILNRKRIVTIKKDYLFYLVLELNYLIISSCLQTINFRCKLTAYASLSPPLSAIFSPSVCFPLTYNGEKQSSAPEINFKVLFQVTYDSVYSIAGR